MLRIHRLRLSRVEINFKLCDLRRALQIEEKHRIKKKMYNDSVDMGQDT